MTAMDELRSLLDGRGVRRTNLGDGIYWEDADGSGFIAKGIRVGIGERDDRVALTLRLSSEQAILVTLGPDPREIKPAGGLARDGICRESMPGRDGPIGRLHSLAEGILDAVRLGAVTGEGIDRAWCRELYDRYSAEFAELGFGEGER